MRTIVFDEKEYADLERAYQYCTMPAFGDLKTVYRWAGQPIGSPWQKKISGVECAARTSFNERMNE